MQGLPSLQSALTVQGVHPAIGVCVQPLTALQASVVHALASLQSSAVCVICVEIGVARGRLQGHRALP